MTKPGESYVHNGVTIIGYTVSSAGSAVAAAHLAGSAVEATDSVQYTLLQQHHQGTTLPLWRSLTSQFLLSIGDQNRFLVNLEDEVVRRSIVTHKNEILWPAPAPAVTPQTAQAAQKPASWFLNANFKC